jgi:hypothetical protein
MHIHLPRTEGDIADPRGWPEGATGIDPARGHGRLLNGVWKFSDEAYAPQLPGLVIPVGHNIQNIASISLTTGSAVIRGARCIVPKTGTLANICIYISATSAGNLLLGVYDSTATNRNLLYTSGSIACPAANAWAAAAQPNIPVVQGQHIDLCVQSDSATATLARPTPSLGGNASSLPTGVFPSDKGAPAKLAWTITNTFANGLPTNPAEAALVLDGGIVAIFANVV